MNEEYFNYAKEILDNMSEEEFFEKLKEHNFNPKRLNKKDDFKKVKDQND